MVMIKRKTKKYHTMHSVSGKLTQKIKIILFKTYDFHYSNTQY